MSVSDDAEARRAQFEQIVSEAIEEGLAHRLVDGSDFGFLDQRLHVIDGVVFDPFGDPVFVIEEERRQARLRDADKQLRAQVDERVAQAVKDGHSHSLVDGDEFGYVGQQLNIVDGAVLRPDDGRVLCEIDPEGIRRLYVEREPPRTDKRWVGVGHGQVVIHYLLKRTRFPISSITDLKQRGQRPTGLLAILLKSPSHTGYTFTLDPPADVRYFGLLSRPQRRLRAVIPWDETFMAILGGRWRDLYGLVVDTATSIPQQASSGASAANVTSSTASE